jgi:hypothetical protein
MYAYALCGATTLAMKTGCIHGDGIATTTMTTIATVET